MLWKRVISALIGLPLLFAAVIIDTRVFTGVVYVIVFIGLYEYFTAVGKSDIKPMKYLGMFCGLVLLYLISNNDTVKIAIPFFTIMILILLSLPVFIQKYSFMGAGATIIGILYIPLCFGYLLLIRFIPDKGVYLIWFVFIVSWLSDTSAYFVGRALGKTKLSPSVSRNKTVEGSIGGILGSILGSIAYGLILQSLSIINIPIWHLFIIGILGSVISQIGDLAASSIKRNVGIKDYGNIMPGHGGLLDRFDSILFAAPLIYYYISFLL